MADFILEGGFSSWGKEPVSNAYLQGRTTAHEVVLICTQVVAAHVRFDDIEVYIDCFVANKAEPRAELREGRQLTCRIEIKRGGVYHEPTKQVCERQPREVKRIDVLVTIKEWIGR